MYVTNLMTSGCESFSLVLDEKCLSVLSLLAISEDDQH